jgi:2-polyprenyl-3-methyl-5-hydroxy-6-metoxy-1,4-benzoquinol methylase
MIFIGHEQEEVERVKFLKKLIENVKTLDMGAADGKLTQQLVDSKKVTAIDFYKDEIRNNPAKRKVIGDITRMPFKNNQFDQVLLFEVLEHQTTADNRIKILTEAKRVLRKKGTLILSTPNKKRLTNYLRKIIGKERIFPYMIGSNKTRKLGDFHYYEYTGQELIDELKKIGFKSVNLEYYYFQIPFINLFFKVKSKLSPGIFVKCKK